jgi:poly-gamma-glutamate synthesis protein (capsule biosynthesis protein)
VHPLPGGRRLIVSACAHESSGVPDDWAALTQEPGVNLLSDFSIAGADDLAARVAPHRLPGDVAVVTIHGGDTWGYDVPQQHINFAHWLIERGFDLVYGHSSHRVRPIEIYRDRLILYGCGDFIDDYEGITGYQRYRDDLVLMLFPSLSAHTGQLAMLEMTPLQIRRMRLNRASATDIQWICDTMNTISRRFGTHVDLTEYGTVRLSRN